MGSSYLHRWQEFDRFTRSGRNGDKDKTKGRTRRTGPYSHSDCESSQSPRYVQRRQRGFSTWQWATDLSPCLFEPDIISPPRSRVPSYVIPALRQLIYLCGISFIVSFSRLRTLDHAAHPMTTAHFSLSLLPLLLLSLLPFLHTWLSSLSYFSSPSTHAEILLWPWPDPDWESQIRD